MNLYFECKAGISGDMTVGALLDLGADENALHKALKSMGLENEFEYKIQKMPVNSIMTTDFDVILKNNPHIDVYSHNDEGRLHCDNAHSGHSASHFHTHRNLKDVFKIIDTADADETAKNLAKKVFTIVAEAEARVHGKAVDEIHFHEVGAIDSIVDIVSFSVLYTSLNPGKVYFSALTEGTGTVVCQHGALPVPVPAVVEIVSKYNLPIRLTQNEGEMVTPTGAAIAAALYSGENLPDVVNIVKIGCGRGKRPYQNPMLRIMEIK